MSDNKVTSVVLGPNGPIELDPEKIPTLTDVVEETAYRPVTHGLPGTSASDITARYARGEQPSLFMVDELPFIRREPGQSGDLQSTPENLEKAREELEKDGEQVWIQKSPYFRGHDE